MYAPSPLATTFVNMGEPTTNDYDDGRSVTLVPLSGFEGHGKPIFIGGDTGLTQNLIHPMPIFGMELKDFGPDRMTESGHWVFPAKEEGKKSDRFSVSLWTRKKGKLHEYISRYNTRLMEMLHDESYLLDKPKISELLDKALLAEPFHAGKPGKDGKMGFNVFIELEVVASTVIEHTALGETGKKARNHKMQLTQWKMPPLQKDFRIMSMVCAPSYLTLSKDKDGQVTVRVNWKMHYCNANALTKLQAAGLMLKRDRESYLEMDMSGKKAFEGKTLAEMAKEHMEKRAREEKPEEEEEDEDVDMVASTPDQHTLDDLVIPAPPLKKARTSEATGEDAARKLF